MSQMFSATGCAEPFTVGNLLVTHANTLYEYTLDGTLVQFVSIPHPDTTRYNAGDVVVDRFGRAHVGIYAPFSNNYIAPTIPLLRSGRIRRRHLP